MVMAHEVRIENGSAMRTKIGVFVHLTLAKIAGGIGIFGHGTFLLLMFPH